MHFYNMPYCKPQVCNTPYLKAHDLQKRRGSRADNCADLIFADHGGRGPTLDSFTKAPLVFCHWIFPSFGWKDLIASKWKFTLASENKISDALISDRRGRDEIRRRTRERKSGM